MKIDVGNFNNYNWNERNHLFLIRMSYSKGFIDIIKVSVYFVIKQKKEFVKKSYRLNYLTNEGLLPSRTAS